MNENLQISEFLHIFTLLLLCEFQSVFSQTFELVFSDEFDGISLDRSSWTPKVSCWGGGNAEKECYVDEEGIVNSTIEVSDGTLKLRAYYSLEEFGIDPEACNELAVNACSDTVNTRQPFKSGYIRTRESNQPFSYGKFEMRAKVPSGTMTWPAFWMLPQDDFYGTWPKSGEIDIMEHRGQEPTISSGAIHFGLENYNFTAGEFSSAVSLSDDFHTYGVIWLEDSIEWFVDDQSFNLETTSNLGAGYLESQPFDQGFYLNLNLAVCGGFFQGDPESFQAYCSDHMGFGQLGEEYVDEAASTFEIDWVRVSRLIDDGSQPVATSTQACAP